MSNYSSIRLPKELHKRVAKAAKAKVPRTSAPALSIHYIESGLASERAAKITTTNKEAN